MPTSSSVAFSFTSFRKASVASATSASWQTRAAPTNSLESAVHSKLRNPPAPRNRLAFASVTQRSPATASISARSAEVTCLRLVSGRARGPCHDRRRAGTPHDAPNLIPAPHFADRHDTLSVAAPMHNRLNPHHHSPVINPPLTPSPKSKTTTFFFLPSTTGQSHRPRHPLTSVVPNFNAHSC